MPDISDLRQRQALPLSAKVLMSQNRIREWYEHWNGDVFVAFSGGKDSTVLAHIVHDIYPDVPLVFVNTGLEYPEIQAFARKMGAEFVRPKMLFSEVISKYGYPIIGKEVAEAIYYARRIKTEATKQEGKILHYIRSRAELDGNRYIGKDGKTAIGGKEDSELNELSPFNKKKWKQLCTDTHFMISHKCCDVIKKSPSGEYKRRTNKYPYMATLAEESRMRTSIWLRFGCNSYSGRKNSRPMSFWTEQDVLQYIKDENLEIARISGNIVTPDADGME